MLPIVPNSTLKSSHPPVRTALLVALLCSFFPIAGQTPSQTILHANSKGIGRSLASGSQIHSGSSQINLDKLLAIANELKDQKTINTLLNAKNLIAQKKESQAKALLAQFLLPSLNDLESRHKAIANAHAKFAFSLARAAANSLDVSLDTTCADTFETAKIKLNPFKNKNLAEASTLLQASLNRLGLFFKKATAEQIASFKKSQNLFFNEYLAANEAIQNRYGSALERAKSINHAIDQFIATGNLNLTSKIHLEDQFKYIEQDKKNEIFRSYVNKDTITAAAFLALGAEGLVSNLLYTGVSAAAKPLILKLTQAAAKGVITGAAATRLADTVKLNGPSGLLSLSSALDALTLAAMLPLPSTQTMLSGGVKGWAAQKVAQVQYQSAGLLAVGSGGYALWLYNNAKQIEDLSKISGQPVLAEDIKRQALAQGLLSIVGGLGSLREQQHRMATDPKYFELLKEARFTNTLGRIGGKASNIWIGKALGKLGTSVKQIKTAPPGVLSKSIAGTKALGWAAQVGYDILAYHAIALTYATYADFNFKKNSDPLPELLPGEIALTLNGFRPEDLLYGSFKSVNTQKDLLLKYKPGVTYFDQDFYDPMDLINQIQSACKKGKIRYLRIGAHGLPGLLVGRSFDIEGSQSSGLFNADFVNKFHKKFEALGDQCIARDAKIQIFSCLVGANLKKPVERNGYIMREKGADELISALGTTLLKKGGTIDSARRMISGFDAVYGSAYFSVLESGIQKQKDPELKAKLSAELAQLKSDLNKATQILQNNPQIDPKKVIRDQIKTIQFNAKNTVPPVNDWQAREDITPANQTNDPIDYSAAKEQFKKFAHKIIDTYLRIYSLIGNYGFNVEGGINSIKHRKDIFPDQQITKRPESVSPNQNISRLSE